MDRSSRKAGKPSSPTSNFESTVLGLSMLHRSALTATPPGSILLSGEPPLPTRRVHLPPAATASLGPPVRRQRTRESPRAEELHWLARANPKPAPGADLLHMFPHVPFRVGSLFLSASTTNGFAGLSASLMLKPIKHPRAPETRVYASGSFRLSGTPTSCRRLTPASMGGGRVRTELDCCLRLRGAPEPGDSAA